MIAILGAGSWGTAIATVAAKNNPKQKIFLWGRSTYRSVFSNFLLLDNIVFTTDLLLAIKDSTYIIIAVPSSGFRELLQKLDPHIKYNKHIIIWATKGLDSASNQLFSHIINDYIPINLPIGILSGPSFAAEVINDLPTAVVLAFAKQHQSNMIGLIEKLQAKNFKIYISHDLIGVQLGGILKNILAVLAGICDGLEFGANARAALIAIGLTEIIELAEKLGANSRTLLGLSGVGDLFLTCLDNQSRNRKFGQLLASGSSIEKAKLKIDRSIEALANIESLCNMADKYKVKLSVVDAIKQIFHQGDSLSIKFIKAQLEGLFCGNYQPE